MKYAEIRVYIDEGEEELTDDDLADVDIAEAIIALEESLPELPKDAKWRVEE